jgi:N-acetylmuramoyl-L-alanine amidase
MPVTGRLDTLGYDLDWCGGRFALNAVIGLVLTALLAGCASVPSPHSGSSETDRTGKPPARNVSRFDPEAQHCVALAMYWEARGEGHQGMLAVGSVVINRVEDDRFPNSVCGVVYQGGETPPCQFSWWCDGRSDRPTQESLWTASLILADELLTARPNDPTHGALFFHNTSTRPPWRRERTTRIGNHVFYR